MYSHCRGLVYAKTLSKTKGKNVGEQPTESNSGLRGVPPPDPLRGQFAKT